MKESMMIDLLTVHIILMEMMHKSREMLVCDWEVTLIILRSIEFNLFEGNIWLDF